MIVVKIFCAMRKVSAQIIFGLILFCGSASAFNIDVGVFYYPGWGPANKPSDVDPWAVIKPYPEREPMLGWYREGSAEITDKHLKWMSDYGINYVIYDWYWSGNRGVYLERALKSYLSLKNRYNVKFSLLWANHTDVPRNIDEFDSMIDFWIDNYLNSDGFYKIDDKPVVYIFSPTRLKNNAKKFGFDVAALLKRANERYKSRGGSGFYFVGSAYSLDEHLGLVVESGFSAVSAYNYHRGFSGVRDSRPLSYSYRELISGYKESWDWMVNNSPIPYHVPVTSGWDRRPWQKDGVIDPHDGSGGNPSDFLNHLIEAKNILRLGGRASSSNLVVCCWNEFGEGSYIEPTVSDGFSYLSHIRTVFGR